MNKKLGLLWASRYIIMGIGFMIWGVTIKLPNISNFVGLCGACLIPAGFTVAILELS